MNEKMLKAEFEHEYCYGEIPFREVFNENEKLKAHLFNEFCKAEFIPKIRLYRRKYYTDEEYNVGMKEANDKIPVSISRNVVVAGSFTSLTDFECHLNEIECEFYELIIKEKLQTKYYLPNINKTNIVFKLEKVESVMTNIRKYVLSNEKDIFEYAESQGETIIRCLDELNMPELKNAVLHNIVNNDRNNEFELNNIIASIMQKNITTDDNVGIRWEKLKNKLNNILTKQVEPIERNDLQKTAIFAKNDLDFYIEEKNMPRQTNRTKHQISNKSITDYFKFNPKNTNYITDYLTELQSIFDLTGKTIFGAVCLALYEEELHKKDSIKTFSKFIDILAKHFNVDPPKDKHKNKYVGKKNELKSKFAILERVLY